MVASFKKQQETEDQGVPVSSCDLSGEEPACVPGSTVHNRRHAATSLCINMDEEDAVRTREYCTREC